MKTRISLLWVAVLVCHILAAQIHIEVSDPDTWNPETLRPYIGSTVVFDVPMVVTNNYNGLTVSTRRMFAPTNQARPESYMYDNIMSLNSTGSIRLNNAPYATGDAYYRGGEKIYNLKATVNSTSSLTWVSGEWRGNTRKDLEEANIRAMVNIDDCDECLLVCTMNLEYYLVETLGGQMGPRDYAAHQRQRTKINKALTKINADLYGFVEIEQGQRAAAEIASDLNENLPDRNYTYINDGGSSNGTYTKSAFVYDRNKLRHIGLIQEKKGGTIPGERHRMICMEEIATGERFIFSVNHFKAKSSGGVGLDSNENDHGQGGYNQTRREEAQSVYDLYKSYYRNAAIKEKDLLVMGDLNAYAKEDPIMVLTNDCGWIDLHREFHADSSYSYTYHGEAGYLDHAICNASLRPQVKGVSGFHINSDESDNYTYDKSSDISMFRCSDHDPVLVGLHLDKSLTHDSGPSLNTLELLNGQSAELTISNAFKEGGQDSYYIIYDIYGRPVMQSTPQKVESDLQSVELPMLPGVYILRIYYDHKVYSYKFIVQ